MKKLWRAIIRFFGRIGEYPGEEDEQAAKRRIFVAITVIATLLTIPLALEFAGEGFTRLAVSLAVVIAAGPVALSSSPATADSSSPAAPSQSKAKAK